MNLTKIINGFKFSKFSKARRTDLGILKVAYMVAALDGEISESEYRTLDALAKKCRGYSAEAVKTATVEAMRSAGYLMLVGRRMKVAELVKEFTAEAQDALPSGFAYLSTDDVRRAFITWVALGMSDGDYSVREKKCIEALRRHFAELKIRRVDEDRERSLALSAAYRPVSTAAVWGPASELISRDFVKRVEALVVHYDDSAAAERELKGLIAE